MPKASTPEEKMQKVEAKQEVVRTTADRAQRAERASFNGTQGKMTVDFSQLDALGYHGHTFNDEPGRIDLALRVGYEFVTPNEIANVKNNVVSRNNDIGEKVRFLVGTDNKGGPLYAYLMKIKKEFYEEDQAKVQAKIDLVDEAIRGGKVTKDGHNTDGFYDAGIKMSRS